MRLAPLLVLVLAGPALAEDDFVNHDQGFRIRRPDAAWSQAEIPAPEESRYALKLWRNDAKLESSVTVFVCDSEGLADSATACDLAKKRFDGMNECSRVERGEGALSNSLAPWLKMRYSVGEANYTLRQHYLVANDALYILQSIAPEEAFDKEPFDAILASFALVRVADPEARKRDALVRLLAKRCGGEVAWAKDWDEASSRARREGKLVVVEVEMYRGFTFPRFSPSTTYMDSDVVELMRERFVGLLWIDGMKAPFLDPKVYGLGPGTFGQGTLFVDPDGHVVAEGVALDPVYFYTHAVEVLAAHPGRPAKDPKDVGELLRRGDLAAAWSLLRHPATGAEWRQQATLLRRMRLGEDALRALAKAREAGEDVDLDEGIIRMRMGDLARADAILRRCEGPEAAYWSACARAMQVGVDPVRADLQAIVTAHPESRWAWRAAAILSNLGVMCGEERITWAEDGVFEATSQRAPAPLDDATRARREAIDFLLAHQLPDGSWATPMGYTGDAPPTVAVTSICGAALLAHRQRNEVALAVRRAEELVLRTELVADPKRQFDYTIWGDLFALRFLARCAEAGVGDHARVVAAMERTIRDLRSEERTDGGWAYARLETGEGQEGNSISFPTAAAVLALLEAKAAGAAVPEGMIDRAASAVARLRRADGTFAYMGLASAGDPAEAAYRSPLCALALLRTGKGDLAGLRTALDACLAHRKHDRRERGKVLCHTSPEGLASYYLLYGVEFASESVGELPFTDGPKYRDALLDDVLYFRTEDGAFCDNPSVGRSYGAGMALASLDELAR